MWTVIFLALIFSQIFCNKLNILPEILQYLDYGFHLQKPCSRILFQHKARFCLHLLLYLEELRQLKLVYCLLLKVNF